MPTSKILGRYDEIENREAEELKQENSELRAARKVVEEARKAYLRSSKIALSNKGPNMKALATALEEYDATI